MGGANAMNRRVFLTNVAAAGAAVGLAPLSSATASERAPSGGGTAAGVLPPGAAADVAPPAPQHLSRALFRRARRARFSVVGHDGRRLELADVQDGPRVPSLDQFTVTFRETTAGLGPLPQGGYSLEHPVHGTLRLHLEPVTDLPTGVRYRATFCLLT
jgi:hypothetical protein